MRMQHLHFMNDEVEEAEKPTNQQKQGHILVRGGKGDVQVPALKIAMNGRETGSVVPRGS